MDEKSKQPNIYVKVVTNIVFYIVAIILLYLFVPRALLILWPFVLAFIIALIANPLVNFLERRIKIVRGVSSGLAIVFIILVIVGAIGGIGYFLFLQIRDVIADLPALLNWAENAIITLQSWLSSLFVSMPPTFDDMLNNALASARNNLFDSLSNLGITDIAVSIARNFIDVILGILIALISSYFFIKYKDKITDWLKEKAPESWVNNYYVVSHSFGSGVGAYLKAQLKLMLIIGVVLFIGYSLTDTGYAFVLALITAVLDALPVFGTGFIIWPWAAFELISGNTRNGVILLIAYLVAQLVRRLLEPKFVGDQVGMNPIVSLIVMFIAYSLAGFMGLIFAIPVVLVFVALYQAGLFDNPIRSIKILIRGFNQFRKLPDEPVADLEDEDSVKVQVAPVRVDSEILDGYGVDGVDGASGAYGAHGVDVTDDAYGAHGTDVADAAYGTDNTDDWLDDNNSDIKK